MSTDTIMNEYHSLQSQLKQALSQMIYTDKIQAIHSQIKELQNTCPHNNGNFDFSTTEECPYCGKKFGG